MWRDATVTSLCLSINGYHCRVRVLTNPLIRLLVFSRIMTVTGLKASAGQWQLFSALPPGLADNWNLSVVIRKHHSLLVTITSRWCLYLTPTDNSSVR